MDNTAKVHLWFRGASEVTKMLRRAGLLCELGAAGAAIWTILAKPQDASLWLPLAILGLTFFGSVLRSYSALANGFAHRCRRISLRAFCAGKDVDGLTVSTLDDDAPPFVDRFASNLPAKLLEEYYEPTTLPGAARQAELYAHSAFYTWRLLRVQSIVMLIVALIGAAASVIVIYYLAAVPYAQVDRRAVLEVVCTVVLLVVTVKGFEASWDAFSSSSSIRSIENALLKKPKGEALKDLVDSYDIERAAGANPMTTIYDWWRDGLSKKWESRRKTFIDSIP